MKFWGFVVTDNRRVGQDIDLFKYEQNAGEKQKIPLSRIELENLIADGGHVVQTQTEYMELVNKYVFGFETMEAYEDLIKLLIQLRSPKLSKDFRPTVIYDILEAALPPLTDEDLRYLSDTIEQMDQTKQQIEQLKREMDAIQKLNHVYTTYNKRVLAEQADGMVAANQRLQQNQMRYDELTEEKTTIDQQIDELTQSIRELEIEQETYRQKEERLSAHDVWNIEKERLNEQERLEKESENLRKKTQQLEQRESKEHQLRNENRTLEETIGEKETEAEEMLAELEQDALDISFDEQHQINVQDYERNQQAEFNFSVWIKEARDHLSFLEKVTDELRRFEQLKEKIQERNKELADEEKKLDDVKEQERQWFELFEEDKSKKLAEIHQWVNDISLISVSEEVLQQVSRAVQSLYEPTSYEQVKDPFRQAVYQMEQRKREELSKLEFQNKQLTEEIREKESELHEWKLKKDPDPETDQITKEARKQLTDQGIPHVPFYTAVEFQDHVEMDTRKRLEAALTDSGVLDALLIDESIKIRHDRVLTSSPQLMAHTLADYLKPDLEESSLISNRQVDEVLRSIVVGEEAEAGVHSLDERGGYQIGLVKGHAVPIDEVRFIGRNARKRYRQEQIDQLQQEIKQRIEQKARLDKHIEEIHSDIAQAHEQLTQFPNDDDLHHNFNQIAKLRMQMEHHQSRMSDLSDQLKEIHQEYSKVKLLVDEKTRTMNIERTMPAYQEAIRYAKTYLDNLNHLEKVHLKKIHHLSRKQYISEQLEELIDEVDELKGEMNKIDDRIKMSEKNLQEIENQLAQAGVQDIRNQIVEVQQKLKDIAEQSTECQTTKPRKEEALKYLEEKINTEKHQLHFSQKMFKAWTVTFEKELNLGFVEEPADEVDVALAKEIKKQYGHLLKEKDGSHLLGRLTDEYYKQQTDLMEYRMTSYDQYTEPFDWMKSVSDEQELLFINHWKRVATRRIIELDYQGKLVNTYAVQSLIEEDYARQENRLNEQDKQLYEEILFNSVGQKLRARIRRAEQWVKQMKQLMENRNTSSGLTFSIKWKPRTAETEEELDTVDLVDLLRQDPRLLKDSDLEKITVHFRSKIDKAKEEVENSSEMQTLLQVLKEVLDYRKWFSFVLYFQREGENRRELTNHQFYKFSGGEKAMAMYIPLFTASYSRYLEAADHAPYIISLDEAFAGVDENNIREMFEIVETLGFDYMMNSQVLWGDYDTISKLSVCELVRPKNADYVTVIRYQWEGEKMALQVDDEQMKVEI